MDALTSFRWVAYVLLSTTFTDCNISHSPYEFRRFREKQQRARLNKTAKLNRTALMRPQT